MLISEFLTRVNYALRGTDDDAPTVGDEEADYWISLLNRKKDELFQDPRLRFASAFHETAPNEVGTVATSATTTLTGTDTKFTDYLVGDTILVDGETSRIIATITSDTSLTVTVAFSNTASGKTFTHTSVIDDGDQTYNLHRSFIYPSDQVYVTKTDGNREYIDLIKPQERDTNSQKVFISGLNPQSLTFTSTISSTDNLVGGTLTAPGFYLPDDISEATDELPIDDPNWAVMAVASEVAFNDVVYESKAPDLTAKANSLYQAMTMKNRAGTFKNSRKVATNVYRIGQRHVR